MHKLDTYPLLKPNMSRMNMNKKSELMTADEAVGDEVER